MTRDELSGLLSHCFQTFYMAKMRRLGSMSPNKRLYLMSVAKLLMENSYLAGEVKVSMESLGMPHHAPSPGHHAPETPHHAPVMGHPGRGPSPHSERELEVVAR
jgi:hypothetical protein